MSSSSDILQDNSLLSRVDRLFFRLETLFALLGGITIVLLVMLAVFNVMGRWLFSLPVSGYIDWVEQFMAVFAFFWHCLLPAPGRAYPHGYIGPPD